MKGLDEWLSTTRFLLHQGSQRADPVPNEKLPVTRKDHLTNRTTRADIFDGRLQVKNPSWTYGEGEGIQHN